MHLAWWEFLLYSIIAACRDFDLSSQCWRHTLCIRFSLEASRQVIFKIGIIFILNINYIHQLFKWRELKIVDDIFFCWDCRPRGRFPYQRDFCFHERPLARFRPWLLYEWWQRYLHSRDCPQSRRPAEKTTGQYSLGRSVFSSSRTVNFRWGRMGSGSR